LILVFVGAPVDVHVVDVGVVDLAAGDLILIPPVDVDLMIRVELIISQSMV